jgi:hypothetical protein
MILRWLTRAQWERKLRRHGFQPLEGKGSLNTAEWWRRPGEFPVTVPVEPDGRADFWAIQKLCGESEDRRS